MIPKRGIVWYALGVCLLSVIPTDTHFVFLNFLEIELKDFINRTAGASAATTERVNALYALLAMVPYVSMIPGSFLANYSMDRFGRKSTALFYPQAVIAISSAMVAVSYFVSSYYVMLAGRILFGMAFGMTNVATSLYLSECSPPESRGVIGSTFAIASGMVQVAANTFYLPWAFGKSYTWHMAFFSIVPISILSILLTKYLPESPKYLHLSKGKTNQAIMVITKFYGIRTHPEEVLHGFEFEQKQTAAKVTTMETLKRYHLRQALWLSLLMGLARCLSGANLLSMFSKSMLTVMLGMSEAKAKYITIGFCAFNMVSGTVGGLRMEKYGRRKIFLTSSFAMLICSCGFAFFSSKTRDSPVFAYPSLVSLALLQVIFYFAPNAMTLFYVTEITPQAARGTIANYGVVLYYATQSLYSFLFPILQERYGAISIVILLVGPSMPVYVYLYLYMPETRNRPVWAVVEDWIRKKSRAPTETAPSVTEGKHRFSDLTNTSLRQQSLENLSFLDHIEALETRGPNAMPPAPPSSPDVSLSGDFDSGAENHPPSKSRASADTAERAPLLPELGTVEIRSSALRLAEDLIKTCKDVNPADRDYVMGVAPSIHIKSSALDLAERILAQEVDQEQINMALGVTDNPAASPLELAKAVITSGAEPKVAVYSGREPAEEPTGSSTPGSVGGKSEQKGLET